MRRYSGIVFVGFVLGLTPSTGAQQSKSEADTPQGRIVMAFYDAGRAGDIEALIRCVTVDAASDLHGSQAVAVLQSFQRMPGQIKVAKVQVNKETATVEAEYWSPPTPASTDRDRPAPSDPGSVTTASGMKISDAYDGRPLNPATLLYPPTPLQQTEAYDHFAPRQTRVTPAPVPGTRVFVDHFQLILVGTEWRIQKVERTTK